MLKADSGATANYICAQDAAILHNQLSTNGPTVQLPNSQSMSSNRKGTLNLSHLLSDNAKTAHVFNNLHSASLLSLGKIYDDGCTVTLTKNKLDIIKNNNVILQG